MSIRKKVAKGMAYAAAPKLSFAAFNPKKAAFVKAASWAMDHVTPERRRRSKRHMAMKGLGAAAMALPVGVWLGRKYLGDEDQQFHRPPA